MFNRSTRRSSVRLSNIFELLSEYKNLSAISAGERQTRDVEASAIRKMVSSFESLRNDAGKMASQTTISCVVLYVK